MELIECKICGKKYRQLTSHITKIHKITCNKYREKYPDSKITSDNLVDKLRQRMLNGQAKTMGMLSSKKIKGCKKPDLSKSMMGNKRGLGTDRSKEKDRYRTQALKQHTEGNFGEWTKERRKKQAEITAERWRTGSLKRVWQPKWQIELVEYLTSINVEFETEYILPQDRQKHGYRLSKPFDFYLPKYNLLIELNGCFWH